MKLWVTLEGHEAEIEIRVEAGKLWLEVEGRVLEADFRRLPDGEVYSLLVDGRSHEVRVAPAAEGLEVTLRGTTVPVVVRLPIEKVLHSVRRASAAGSTETILAPMPGLVVRLRVAPGDWVDAGQAVAVIEAMKMQNELVSRAGGIVDSILVRERASVSVGQPIMRLRPETS